jgi:outer membrane protein OmpA-like peptidoglycan-associated protein
MRVFFTGFVVFLVFALFSRWYFVCEIRHHCGNEQLLPSRPMTLTLKDSDKIILRGYEQFGFEANAIEPVMTENNQAFLKKVAEYLRQFPDKNLTLTGRFLESEKNARTGIFENLGIARAAAVERLLSKLGIDEKRISIDHQMVRADALQESIGFSLFTPQKDKPEAYQKLEYKFTDNTFSDANFEYNSDVFRPGEQCIAYADSVKKFLDLHPEMMLSIIGHTDSIGSETYNHNLGLRRAKKASEYFRELGVKAKINVASKGKTQPVAPNTNPDGTDYPEGRQKNRRVNFKINDVQ